jgi:tRNA (guanine37-N1)-methyltransferase
MQFDIITIFPKFFDSFVSESLIKRARESGLIKINVHNLRDFSDGPHQVVDDRAFGGGIGMVLKIEPIYKAIKKIKRSRRLNNRQKKVVLFTPRGKEFNQRTARRFSKNKQLIMICGRYEGVDERVGKYLADEQISFGPYVTMGGELGAMIVIEAVSRLIPGVINKPELLKQRLTKSGGFIEYPQYSRPEIFIPEKGKKWRVPKVLLSGHHKKIGKWRENHSKIIGES